MENTIENYNLFEKENHLQPDFDKSEFDSLHSWDFGWAVLEPINIASDNEKEIQLSKQLSPGQKALYFFWYLDEEVTNGGFIQFYLNGTRRYLSPILNGLKLIGDNDLLSLVEKVDRYYLANQSKFELQQDEDEWESLYNDLKEFEVYDRDYYSLHDKTMDLIEQYARQHPSEFLNIR